MVSKQQILDCIDEYGKLQKDSPFERFLKNKPTSPDFERQPRDEVWEKQWEQRESEVERALVSSARDLAAPTAERGDTKLSNRLLRLAKTIEGQHGDAGTWETFLRNVKVAAMALPDGGKSDTGLTRAVERAYQAFELAEQRMPEPPKTDREAYDWIHEDLLNLFSEYELPPVFDTWQSYVRQGRRHHGTQKNKPRGARAGRSIVNAEDQEIARTNS